MYPNVSECIRIGPNRSQHVSEATKTSKILRKLSENFAIFLSKKFFFFNFFFAFFLFPKASEWIRTYPHGSKQVRKRRKTSKNVAKTSKNFAKASSIDDYKMNMAIYLQELKHSLCFHAAINMYIRTYIRCVRTYVCT